LYKSYVLQEIVDCRYQNTDDPLGPLEADFIAIVADIKLLEDGEMMVSTKMRQQNLVTNL